MRQSKKTIDRLAALTLLRDLNNDILKARTPRSDQYNPITPKVTTDAFVKGHTNLIELVKRELGE